MELTKQHRAALLRKLDKAKEERQSVSDAYDTMLKRKDEGSDKFDADLLEWWDIDKFLLGKQIELIEQSLIQNDIDY